MYKGKVFGDLPSKDFKREGRRQSNQRRNCSKGSSRKTSKRRDGLHVDFSEGIDTDLNSTKRLLMLS